MRALGPVAYAFAAAIAFGAPASAADDGLAKVRVAADGKDGAIAFFAAPGRFDYRIMFSRLDTATGGVTAGEVFRVSRSRGAMMPGSDLALQAKVAKPGRYVVRMITWQEHWAGCLSEASLAFDVRPGEVALIGTLDARPTFAAISAEAVRTGKTSAVRGQVRVFENVALPLVTAPEAMLTAFAAKTLTGATDRIRVGPVEPASFVRRDKAGLFLHCS